MSRSFAVKARRPRRGGAERQGGSSREGGNVEARSLRIDVRLLHAPYLPQALADAPVEVHAAHPCPVRPERGFLRRGELVLVEAPLERCPGRVAPARISLPVVVLPLCDEHFAGAEEVPGVRPVVAQPGELVLQGRAVQPDLAEELSSRRPVLLLHVGVVVASPRPRPPQEGSLRLDSRSGADVVVEDLPAVVGME